MIRVEVDNRYERDQFKSVRSEAWYDVAWSQERAEHDKTAPGSP